MGININLSGQNAKMAAALPYLQDLQTAMEQRRVVWNRRTPAEKRKWIQSNKDLVMTRMYQVRNFLNGFFDDGLD